MRLAVVTQNVIKGDGQGRANYEIVRNAARNGVEITLIADRVDEDLLKEERITWVPLHPKYQNIALFRDFEFQVRANQILDKMRGQFDVVHGYGFVLNRRHQINTSQFVHSAWRRSPMHTSRGQHNFYGIYQWVYSAINAVGEKAAYQKAKIVVAASHTVRKELMDIGISEDRLRVILNGADPREFHPGSVDRKELGLQENVPLALFAGDIRTNRKNLDTVLKALVSSPTTYLAVVGKLADSPFPKMAEELGVSDRVKFLDFRRDIANIMRGCDMFVFPSRYEACALVLVEAIASGLPVITAKTTGGSEVVTPESGILLDDANDAVALSAAMNRLSGDQALRASMSACAWDESKKHTWEHVSGAYLDLYREFAK